MIAIHDDPLIVSLTRVRRRMAVLRCCRPVPHALLCLLALEEIRLLRCDAERRRS